MKTTMVKLMVVIIGATVIGMIAALVGLQIGASIYLVISSMNTGLTLCERLMYLMGGIESGVCAIKYGWPTATTVIPEFIVGKYNKYIKEFIE